MLDLANRIQGSINSSSILSLNRTSSGPLASNTIGDLNRITSSGLMSSGGMGLSSQGLAGMATQGLASVATQTLMNAAMQQGAMGMQQYPNNGMQQYPNNGMQQQYPNNGMQQQYPNNGMQQQYPNNGMQQYPNNGMQQQMPAMGTQQAPSQGHFVSPTTSAQPIQSAQSMQQAQPTQPIQQVQPTQPMQQAQPAQPIQQVQPTQPVQPAQPVPTLVEKPVPSFLKQIQKGQKVPLSAGTPLTNIKVLLGWNTTNPQCELDVSAFLLGANGKVLGDDWFVFYGQELSPDGSTKFSIVNDPNDRELIQTDFNTLNPAVEKIVYVLTINEAMEKNLNFSMVKDGYIRIFDTNTNTELVSYMMADYYPNVISMMLGEVYKHNGSWKFNAVGNGVARDLAGLCELYGVQVI